MPVFERKCIVEAPVKELFNWHSRPLAFERLIPPWDNIKVLEKEPGIKTGSRVILQMKQGLLNVRWEIVHGDYVQGRQFRDFQEKGPFAKWIHTHQFLPVTEKTSQLIDSVDYEAPLGVFGRVVAGHYIGEKLKRTFTFRHTRTQNDLKRTIPFAGKGPLKIAMSGASGMIGRSLSQFLSCAGHEVRPLVRRQPRGGEIYWNPEKAQIDPNSLEGVDVVIHLAGENIGSARWTAARKKLILESRSVGTEFLAETLASLRNPPKVFIASSAIGFYGDRSEEILTEQSSAGKGFLTEVCEAWEGATGAAKKVGIRAVNIRTGIVLSAKGGALPKMVLPTRMGVGGVIGSGRQWMSWIAMEDLIGIFNNAMYNPALSGPINAVSPEAVTNRAFIQVLGKVLKRPTFFPLPGFVVKILLGEMGKAFLLAGQRVKPDRLTQTGFEFLYPDLESALRWELGRFI